MIFQNKCLLSKDENIYFDILKNYPYNSRNQNKILIKIHTQHLLYRTKGIIES